MILLDTHVLIWLTRYSSRLGLQTREIIAEAEASRRVYVSAITFWEIALLKRKGKLDIPDSAELFRSLVFKHGCQEVPLDGSTCIRSANLSGFQKDPADRLIIATALDGYTLITADSKILNWENSLPRIDARQ